LTVPSIKQTIEPSTGATGRSIPKRLTTFWIIPVVAPLDEIIEPERVFHDPDMEVRQVSLIPLKLIVGKNQSITLFFASIQESANLVAVPAI
jgi:hypothetical protein